MRRIAAAILFVLCAEYVNAAMRQPQVVGSNVISVRNKKISNTKKLSASNQLMYLLLRYAQRHCNSTFRLRSTPGLDDLDMIVGNMSVVGESLIGALDGSRSHRENGMKAMRTLTKMQCTYARGISMILKMEIDGAAREHNSTCTQLSWVAEKAHRYRRASISKLKSVLEVAVEVEMNDIRCIKRQMRAYVKKLQTVRRYFKSLKKEKSNYLAAKKAGTIMLVMIVQYADIAHEVTKLQQAKNILLQIKARIKSMQRDKAAKDKKEKELVCFEDKTCVKFMSRQARMTRSIYGMLRKSSSGRSPRSLRAKDNCGLTVTSEIPEGGIRLNPDNKVDTDALFRKLERADQALLSDMECLNRLVQSVTLTRKTPNDQQTTEGAAGEVDESLDDPMEMSAEMSPDEITPQTESEITSGQEMGDETDYETENVTQAITTKSARIYEGAGDRYEKIRDLQRNAYELESAVEKLQKLKETAAMVFGLPSPATDAAKYASALRETADAIAEE